MAIDIIFLVSDSRFEESFVSVLAPEIKIYSNMAFSELIFQTAAAHRPVSPPHPFLTNETSFTSIMSYQPTAGDGFPGYWAGRSPSGYRLQVDTIGIFDIAESGRFVQCIPAASASAAAIAGWFLGPVVGLALALNHHFCLHGSAVRINNRAVGFLGRSGAGKSTLCAGFRKLGMPLVADDLLLIRNIHETYLTLPVFMRQKIWTETRHFLESGPNQAPAQSRHKGYFETEERDFFDVPMSVPLQTIYLLQPQSPSHKTIQITPLSKQEAMIAIIQYTVAARLFEPSLAAQQFAFCAGLAQQVAVRRLDYPHDFPRIPEVQQTILDDLTQTS